MSYTRSIIGVQPGCRVYFNASYAKDGTITHAELGIETPYGVNSTVLTPFVENLHEYLEELLGRNLVWFDHCFPLGDDEPDGWAPRFYIHPTKRCDGIEFTTLTGPKNTVPNATCEITLNPEEARTLLEALAYALNPNNHTD